jgi:hypothetical protein
MSEDNNTVMGLDDLIDAETPATNQNTDPGGPDFVAKNIDPEGAPEEVVPTPYREMTEDEIAWTDPKTPRQYKRRVRISCVDGIVANGNIYFEDGEELTNVVRIVIVMATTTVPGSKGFATVMITQFHNEIGEFVYTAARALVGEPPETEADQGAPPADLTDAGEGEPDLQDPGNPDVTDRPTIYGHDVPDRRISSLTGANPACPKQREEDERETRH